jgi:hypothetical protein
MKRSDKQHKATVLPQRSTGVTSCSSCSGALTLLSSVCLLAKLQRLSMHSIDQFNQ